VRKSGPSPSPTPPKRKGTLKSVLFLFGESVMS